MIMNIVTVLLSGARKIIVACMIYVIILYLSKKIKWEEGIRLEILL